ncbi:unnamed protein product, partial [Effrenium voratum]
KCMQACCMKQHAAGTVHKVAQEVFLSPDRPIADCLPYSLSDQALWSGNVPQPKDWLRAWRCTLTPSSFCAAAKFYQTDDYADGRKCSVARRRCLAAQNMLTVMQWAVKAFRKERLQQANSISISVDDRKNYRLVRYCCSLPAAAACPDKTPPTLEEWCCLSPSYHEGLLGAFKCGGDVPENTLAAHDEDKSQSMANSIIEVFRRACQDPDGQVDMEALQDITSKVQHMACDQCAQAQKCGHILSAPAAAAAPAAPCGSAAAGGPATGSAPLPRLAWVSADPAHQVRIAARDPLHALEEFKVQWERLFGGRHALIPDVQNSEVWRSRLIAAQKAVLKAHGEQGGELDRVLQTFSFAKHRFDSTSTPMLKYCLLIRSMALLCAMQERGEKKLRQRAADALQHMVAPELMRCALTVDFTSECTSFLREQFDVDDVDAACNFSAFHAFRIWYGNKVHYICTRASVADIRGIMAQLSDVTQAMLHRLDVDLLGDEISSCLRIFDVPLWRKAERRGDLQSACFKLCSILGLPHPRTVVAFVSSAAQALLPQLDAAATQHLHVPNKLAWTWALIPAWRAKHTAGRLGATRECEQLVAFYLACKINTTPLERNLGKLLEQLQAHSGPLADNGCTAAALIEVALDGPRREEELFTWARGAPGNPAASADTAGMAMPTHFARLKPVVGRGFKQQLRAAVSEKPCGPGAKDIYKFQEGEQQVYPLFLRYTASPPLKPAAGYVMIALMLPPTNADVLVLDQLSDMETAENEYLALSLAFVHA